MPEYVLASLTAALLGWGGFTWKRAEDALFEARRAADMTDKLELKVAESYLTKHDFDLHMERIVNAIERFEHKLDRYTYRK